MASLAIFLVQCFGGESCTADSCMVFFEANAGVATAPLCMSFQRTRVLRMGILIFSVSLHHLTLPPSVSVAVGGGSLIKGQPHKA
ncbi:hypothetical protein OF83DRAFT_1180184 [Amylostereum chailletii]|nr:hypothetical protein OF83DRAFT_1180184 [Amylostereum chailletii]